MHTALTGCQLSLDNVRIALTTAGCKSGGHVLQGMAMQRSLELKR